MSAPTQHNSKRKIFYLGFKTAEVLAIHENYSSGALLFFALTLLPLGKKDWKDFTFNIFGDL
jgi:hypothetical protein